MQKLKNAFVILASAAAFAPLAAQADDTLVSVDTRGDRSPRENNSSDIGVTVTVGGGVTGFTDKAMRGVLTSNVSGLWGLRMSYGSRSTFAVDVNYAGTSANINAPMGNKSGTLIGTTLEAALRYNLLPHYAWNPYAFAGMGWQRYDVTGPSMHIWDSGVSTGDNSAVFPFGGGVVYRAGNGLVFDAHGTFRLNTNSGLVAESPARHGYVSMHTWEASTGVGYEF